MSVTKLAVLGGSGVATPELINALLRWSGEARPALHVVLLGRSPQKLERVRQVCEQMVKQTTPTMWVEATTDWRRGLEGADFVLNQVRVGGLEARAHDETFPRVLGIPGEETIGPGGFANALRTLPAIIDAFNLVSEVAPGATVLNLTNPAGLVQYAATRYTSAQVISLCDSPITLGDELAKLVERPRAQLEISYLGMNHLGWALALRDAEQGDVLNLALERAERLSSLGVDPAYIRATRAIPIAYVRYYVHPDRVLAQQQGRAPRARQLQALEEELLADYERDSTAEADASLIARSVAKRGALWYDAIVVPVLDALLNDRGSTRVVNVTNGHLVPWLPADTVIEVPARVDKRGAHPLPVPAHLLAEDLRALLFAQAMYESLVAPAIITRDRELALRALMAHPLVRTFDVAERVLEAVWPSGGGGSAS